MSYHDIALVHDGGGVYAVFATNAHAQLVAEAIAPTLEFEHDPGGILPSSTTVAAMILCCEKCVWGFCTQLRNAGLIVARE